MLAPVVKATAVVACVSHEATAALNSIGAAPVRLQPDDHSASGLLAQPARATEMETARFRIESVVQGSSRD